MADLRSQTQQSGRPAKPETTNNFDLIRLFAAAQVVIYHGFKYIGGSDSAVAKAIDFVPGVPIFFFVSGFLISASYARSSSLRSFARKRVLRIYPALWLCIALTVVVLIVTGYLADEWPGLGQFGVWVVAQASFLQFYNPDWSRHYGAGIVNPALWTICVELQFYVAMPILAAIYRRSRSAYLVLFAGLVAFSAAYSLVIHPSAFGDTGAGKLLGVTCLPWICMFMLGSLAEQYAPLVRRYTDGKAATWAGVYVVLAAVALVVQETSGVYISGNALPFVLFVPLAALVLSIAYTRPQTGRVLRGNDLSYGLYLFHMPVIGTWLYLSGSTSWWAIPVCLVLSLAVAAFSWFTIEQRALRFRGRSAPPALAGWG